MWENGGTTSSKGGGGNPGEVAGMEPRWQHGMGAVRVGHDDVSWVGAYGLHGFIGLC